MYVRSSVPAEISSILVWIHDSRVLVSSVPATVLEENHKFQISFYRVLFASNCNEVHTVLLVH